VFGDSRKVPKNEVPRRSLSLRGDAFLGLFAKRSLW